MYVFEVACERRDCLLTWLAAALHKNSNSKLRINDVDREEICNLHHLTEDFVFLFFGSILLVLCCLLALPVVFLVRVDDSFLGDIGGLLLGGSNFIGHIASNCALSGIEFLKAVNRNHTFFILSLLHLSDLVSCDTPPLILSEDIRGARLRSWATRGFTLPQLFESSMVESARLTLATCFGGDFFIEAVSDSLT